MNIKAKLITFLESKESTDHLLQPLRDLVIMRRKKKVANMQLREKLFWDRKIVETTSCPDNPLIIRVLNAGELESDNIVMHNGVKICFGSYANYHMQRLLLSNKGVHEPQEEYVFQEVLKFIPDNGIILELGAFWGFYSLWFKKVIRNATCFLVEPDLLFLNQGRLNFLINNETATFINAFIDVKPSENIAPPPTRTIDGLMEEYSIEHLNILHTDTQGFEFKILQGGRKTFAERRIDYVFVSTHSPRLHRKCLDFLIKADFTIVACHTLDESYSMDGLIVGRRKELNGLDECIVSKKIK